MKLVVGLGNPGPAYVLTRHNLGAIILDALAEGLSLQLSRRGRGCRYASGQTGGEAVMLARPETYMNLSGDAVAQVARYYRIMPPDIIVIHDDLDLPFGDIRVKEGGGDGGHKGLISIIGRLGTSDFLRIRAGIGRPAPGEAVEAYVLGRLTDAELEEVPRMADRGKRAVQAVIASGAGQAMNEFNMRQSKKAGKEV